MRSSLSISSHFAANGKSKIVKPVILTPGRARLETKPSGNGSGTCMNTIGTVFVIFLKVPPTAGGARYKYTFGLNACALREDVPVRHRGFGSAVVKP